MANDSVSISSAESEYFINVEEPVTNPEDTPDFLEDLPFIPVAVLGQGHGLQLIHMGPGKVLYAAAHYGILFDYDENTQHMLIGHKNPISSIATDPDRKFVVTADRGRWESLVYLWKVGRWQISFAQRIASFQRNLAIYDGVCHRTDPIAKFKAPSSYGTRFVAISQDARYVITLSEGLRKAVLNLWVLSSKTAPTEPAAVIELPEEHGHARNIAFCPDCTEFAVVTCSRNVVFLNWTKKTWKVFPPHELVPEIGRFVCSIYMADTGRAATITARGNVIVWAERVPSKPANQKVNVDVVKVEHNVLTTICETDKMVVIGNKLGHIRFYSQDFKTLYLWIIEGDGKAIMSISFSVEPVTRPEPGTPLETPLHETMSPVSFPSVPLEGGPLNVHPGHVRDTKNMLKMLIGPMDLNAEPDENNQTPELQFIARDLIMNTASGRMVLMSFKHRRSVVLKDSVMTVTCVAAHPTLPYLYVGGKTGEVKLMDFDQLTRVSKFKLSNKPISSLRVSPDGHTLFLGISDGSVTFLHPIVRSPPPFRERSHSRSIGAVFMPIFSNDSEYLAHCDADDCVSVYRCLDKAKGRWLFLGKRKVHHGAVRDLIFSTELHGGSLFSLGKDRLVVEYDIVNSLGDNLRVKRIDRIQKVLSARSLCWCSIDKNRTGLLVVFAEDTMNLINIEDRTCVRAVYGPVFPSPVNTMLNMSAFSTRPHSCEGDTSVLFATHHYVGLLKVPPDGNPYHCIGMFGHPEKITSVILSGDKQFLFIGGRGDSGVIVHKINLKALEKRVDASPPGIQAFIQKLPGGCATFKEMLEAFVYAQVEHEGLKTKRVRNVSNEVPLCELPDLLRVAGAFPSQFMCEYLMQEVTAMTAAKGTTTVTFNEYVKLVHNYNRGRGTPFESIRTAFNILAHANPDEEDASMTRERFISFITEKGDPIDPPVLKYILRVLLGDEEVASGEKDSKTAAFKDEQLERERLFSFLPDNITFSYFLKNILGIVVKEL